MLRRIFNRASFRLISPFGQMQHKCLEMGTVSRRVVDFSVSDACSGLKDVFSFTVSLPLSPFWRHRVSRFGPCITKSLFYKLFFPLHHFFPLQNLLFPRSHQFPPSPPLGPFSDYGGVQKRGSSPPPFASTFPSRAAFVAPSSSPAFISRTPHVPPMTTGYGRCSLRYLSPQSLSPFPFLSFFLCLLVKAKRARLLPPLR